MRVLLLSSLWPPAVLGGAELHAAQLAERLVDAGHEVGVVTYGSPGERVIAQVPSKPYPLQEFANQPASKRALMHLRDVWNPDTGSILENAITEFAPDVVHSHTVQGMSAVALTRPGKMQIPHVHTLHDYWLLCQRTSMVQRDGTACTTSCRGCAAITAVRERQVRGNAPDVVLGVSKAVAAEHERLEWASGRVRVLYNPVESPPEPRPVRSPGKDVGAPVFGYLGQLAAYKGVGTLLSAFKAADIRGSRLLVGGRGPLLGEVQAAGAAPSGGVEALGWVGGDTKEQFFNEIDCLVVPSEWSDPAPIVLNEARARGIPVIGADTGGIPELISHAATPLLFPSKDAAALADRLRIFAANASAYTSPPELAPVDWAGHLEGLMAAYRDAGSG
ncbi:glycosyltransferase [Actinobacteria bacterium IMCC26256]|nr:glycosyltransferase [Actinobacteria bacterium IMCC26256]